MITFGGGGDLEVQPPCGGLPSMEIHDFFEIGIGSTRIVVEELEPLRARLAGEIDRLVEGRMSPVRF